MKYEFIEVTSTEKYMIPIYADTVLDNTLKEWFEDFPASRHHAARESSKVGTSQKFVSVKRLKTVKF